MDRKYTQFTPEKKEKFLNALRKWPNVSRAARSCGISRKTAYNHIDPDHSEYDPEFTEEWREALEEGLDRHEEEMERRAYKGVLEPVFYKGEKVGTVRKYSDTLAIFLYKVHRNIPDKSTVELIGKDGAPIVITYVNHWRDDPPGD